MCKVNTYRERTLVSNMMVELGSIQCEIDLDYRWKIVIALVGSGVTLTCIKWIRDRNRRNLNLLRIQKSQAREDAIRNLEHDLRTSSLPAEKRTEILAHDFTTLKQHLKLGKLNPVEVLTAYQYRVLEVHRRTNCLVEPIQEALAQAQQLQNSNNKEGMLYGIPVSIKDNYGIRGYDCTLGCARSIDKPWTSDCTIVKLLKEEGAIPFVKTNVPQTMLSFETTNPIFGATKNTQDLSRGVGGSSGGEAALISSGGSILGFGSDLGGSIRVPANMCGIYGIKPTFGRVSTKGMHPIFKGQTNVHQCYGPMGRDVDSLVGAVRLLCSPRAFALDPTLPPLPFDESKYKSKGKLKIGFFTSLDYVEAVPAMQRAVLETKAVLESLGHEVVPWSFPMDVEKIMSQWRLSAFGDGGRQLSGMVEDDALDEAMQGLIGMLNMPKFLIRALSYLIFPFDRRVGSTLSLLAGLKNVREWWNLNEDTAKTKDIVVEDWMDCGLDALVCPGFACSALPLGATSNVADAAVYTLVFNILDFVAGSLPVTRVSAEDVVNMKGYPEVGIWHQTIKQGTVGTEGLSANVQVVTPPWKEETCLRLMKEIEGAVNFDLRCIEPM